MLRQVVFAAVFMSIVVDTGAQTSKQHQPVTIEQVNRWETKLSNWGRWGKDDERGALNLITPQKEVAAARLVKDGVTVSLAHFADLEKAADNFNFAATRHEMVARDPATGKVRGAFDSISFGIHDGTNSHLDALCHYAVPRLLNGKTFGSESTPLV
jgi:hypothetical protein